MDERELEVWKQNVKKVCHAQIILNRMKESGKFKRKDLRVIEGRIKRLRYKTHINSPMFEHKPELKDRVAIRCNQEWNQFMLEKFCAPDLA